jgi:hypothetical protein
LRAKLKVVDQLRPDMKTIVFKLKDLGLIKNYERVPDNEMPDDEAFFDSRTRILYLRETTFCAADATQTFSSADRRRARYTIAHEVGHIALGHQGIHYRGTSDRTARALSGRIRRDEWEADRFAAAFLAPAHLVD